MKLLSKISIFLLSAAIFMSALVVFAENNSSQSAEWPYIKFNISISDKNKISESSEAQLSEKISDAVSAPFFALTRDYPDLTMWTTGFSTRSSYSIVTSGTKKTYTLTDIEYTFNGNPNYGDPKGMLDQLNGVVNSFTPSGSTMYDKLLDIHDFICEINTYVKESEGGLYCYSAYGSLVNHKSVCEGYAEAFKLLCDKAEIECILVTGMSLPSNSNTMEGHMWNLVRMDDGEWYAVDVTWDDAGDVAGNYNYFLVGTDTVIRGKKFTESHFASYDFINIGGNGKTITDLEYPTVSSIAYDKENGRTEYTYGGERFHYNALDDIQKEIYDKMLEALRNNMPSNPDKTPVPDTTDDPLSSTNQSSSTPEETTTVKDTTVADTTTVKDTTEADTTTAGNTTPSETTTPDESTKPPVITTEKPQDSTTETVSDPNGTTPSSTTKPPETSTQKETDPPVSSTTEKPDTTVTDTSSDTTEKPNNTGNITTQGNGNASQEREMQKLYDTVTTVVIISAITSLSVIIGIFVIRYAKKHK